MTANSSIVRKSLWTISTYAASAGTRFGSNIVLSRLLGPEILGVAVIAQVIRLGCDLLTDLGPEQNVVPSSLVGGASACESRLRSSNY